MIARQFTLILIFVLVLATLDSRAQVVPDSVTHHAGEHAVSGSTQEIYSGFYASGD